MNALLRRARVDRERLEAALVDEVVENGLARATVEGVCDRAETDRAGFESHFTDLEDAYYQVCKRFRDELIARVLPAFAGQSAWRDRIRAVAYAMFDYVDEDRTRGYFLFVEILAAGERAQRLRDEGTEVMIGLIDQGRNELEDPELLTPATAQAIAGSIYQQIRGAVERDDADAAGLVPKLMYNVVLPYVGPAEAQRELTMPRPVAQGRGAEEADLPNTGF